MSNSPLAVRHSAISTLPNISEASMLPLSDSHGIRSVLEKLGLDAIPPHPARERKITIPFKMLHCEPLQLELIKQIYVDHRHFHQVFSDAAPSQEEAVACLREQNLIPGNFDDLANGWSRRWSNADAVKSSGKKVKERVLFQCQSGTSTEARQNKVRDKKFLCGETDVSPSWKRKMPYDYTGCLAHIDLTYGLETLQIFRITGMLEHNEACVSKMMTRLPSIPLHPHVWLEAVEQVNKGANLTTVQKRNQELYQSQLYNGQATSTSTTQKANFRYIFQKGDSRSLYRKQASSLGVDLLKQPAENIEDWLNPDSLVYKPELAAAVFFYQGRTHIQERFMLCIHTQEMKDAAWQYAHNQQLILDGMFGICDRRVLLFIALGVDIQNKGIPLAFFLFSAPTGSQATHAGYDTTILTQLLKQWVKGMGTKDGQAFVPLIAITDTDTKERGALLSVWPNITLLLCKFHTRQCWTNKRKLLVKTGQTTGFEKDQLIKRLRNLENGLIASNVYTDALSLVASERAWLLSLGPNAIVNQSTINGALAYTEYLTNYWLPKPMWECWSAFGRYNASEILKIPLDGVIPTTNHLEAFNGLLKHKYIRSYQKNGRRLRIDLLVFLLITRILPTIYTQRSIEKEYQDWLSQRFCPNLPKDVLVAILARKKSSTIANKNTVPGTTRSFAVTWWSSALQSQHHFAAQSIITNKRISDFKWIESNMVEATCASSLSNIHAPNHLRYQLCLNPYGLATCSCPFNSLGNGACKHLWAFRYILPTLSPEVSFYFPLTEKAALEIHTVFDLANPIVPDSSVPPLVLPQLKRNQLASVATMANTLGGESDASDEEDDEADEEEELSDKSDVEADTPDISVTLGSREALKVQLHGRITHKLTALLPRLHGLSLMLKDGKEILKEIPEVFEFKELLIQIDACLPEASNNITSQTNAFNSMTTTSNNRAFATTTSKKRVVLAPEPERSQKRQRSTATL